MFESSHRVLGVVGIVHRDCHKERIDLVMCSNWTGLSTHRLKKMLEKPITDLKPHVPKLPDKPKSFIIYKWLIFCWNIFPSSLFVFHFIRWLFILSIYEKRDEHLQLNVSFKHIITEMENYECFWSIKRARILVSFCKLTIDSLRLCDFSNVLENISHVPR